MLVYRRCRTIRGLFPRARIDQFAEPFVTFVAIDSETDAVPVGRFRELWHRDAKIKFEAEWSEAENYAKSVGEPACRAAIAWVEGKAPDSCRRDRWGECPAMG